MWSSNNPPSVAAPYRSWLVSACQPSPALNLTISPASRLRQRGVNSWCTTSFVQFLLRMVFSTWDAYRYSPVKTVLDNTHSSIIQFPLVLLKVQYNMNIIKQYKAPFPECYMTFWSMFIAFESSITQAFHERATLLPNWTYFRVGLCYQITRGLIRTFATDLACQQKLLLLTFGLVPFGLGFWCLSYSFQARTCHFRTLSHGASIWLGITKNLLLSLR